MDVYPHLYRVALLSSVLDTSKLARMPPIQIITGYFRGIISYPLAYPSSARTTTLLLVRVLCNVVSIKCIVQTYVRSSQHSRFQHKCPHAWGFCQVYSWFVCVTAWGAPTSPEAFFLLHVKNLLISNGFPGAQIWKMCTWEVMHILDTLLRVIEVQ